MSFTLPRNVPRFDDAQRGYENVYWSQAQNGHVRSAVGGIFEREELPMYKDKPYNYARSTKQPFWRRRRVQATTLSLLLMVTVWMYFAGIGPPGWASSGGEGSPKWRKRREILWHERKQAVRTVFETSWDGYERHAFGEDEYHPIAQTGNRIPGNGLGSILVDSLDTLMIMNLTSRLSRARHWITNSMLLSQNLDVSAYYTASRLLGGLLSAHYLSTELPDLAPASEDELGSAGEDLYIEKATDLADRLLGAFDSPTGIAYPLVNLETRQGGYSKGNGKTTQTAHAAGALLEYRYLSFLLGEKLFWNAAEKSIERLDFGADSDGLVTGLLSPDSGDFVGSREELSDSTISYYESLIKQYLQTSKQELVYQQMWTESLSGIRNKLIHYSDNGHLVVAGERASDMAAVTVNEAACKLPGLLALASTEGRTLEQAKRSQSWDRQKENDLTLAKELIKSCWALYKTMPTGLAAAQSYVRVKAESSSPDASVHPSQDTFLEGEWRNDISVSPELAYNNQDPSLIESLFYLWRILGDETYREWGWEVFESYTNYTRITPRGDGYVSLASITSMDPPKQIDEMNPRWLSRTLKFFYLLFAPREFLPLDGVILTSGGHVLPRFRLLRGLKTGLKRKTKDSAAILPSPVDQLEMLSTKLTNDVSNN